MATRTLKTMEVLPTSLWACPFRPFFLATAAYAILALAGWLGILLGGWGLAGDYPPLQWHSHEMLFGVVGPAIAGFLLTAMCQWTGATPLSGRGLQALFAIWLAGRLAFWLAALIPQAIVVLLDGAFLVCVALYAGRVIVAFGNRRNLLLVAVVSALALANLTFHLGWWLEAPLVVRRAELATIGLIVLLMGVIGGRITPLFTRNWMLRRGQAGDDVGSPAWVERTSLLSLVLLVPAVVIGLSPGFIAVLASIAALSHALRLFYWRGWRTSADPLVWILHVGYAWIPIGLGLMALHYGLGYGVASAWLHALGPGAMGVLILGVMTRVGLGHTGRDLILPAGAVATYGLILVSALTRLGTALGWLPWRPGIGVSAVTWAGAFAVFLWCYWSILTQPRADGRPG